MKDFLITAADGKKYQTKFYNLDMIISIGYRIKSHIATRFRQWATQQLRELTNWKNRYPNAKNSPKC
ncbi:MAG: virulence RhuM family protein [Nitrospirae bacterium]|nr:virulence RhuM family protein [Nitrospirota bacterium]